MSFIVMSAFRACLDISENLSRTNDLKRYVHEQGLTFKNVIGFFREQGEQPKKELSIVVPCDKDNALKLAEYSKTFEQDCVLFVDDNLKGSLIYPDKQTIDIGYWKEATTTTDNYTLIDGQKFTVK